MNQRILREPFAWLAVLAALVGACAPALGDLLDGGEGSFDLVDDSETARITVDEEDCESDDGGKTCEYTIEDDGDEAVLGEQYRFTLWYGAGGEVRLTGLSVEGGEDADLDVTLMPEDAEEGDEESEEDGDLRFSLELRDADSSAKDASGDRHSGCAEWRYTNARGGSVDAFVCPGIGLTELDFGEISLRRD